jgi:hypothetical protein
MLGLWFIALITGSWPFAICAGVFVGAIVFVWAS